MNPNLGKMTVDEFFEWQQRQDRNYELVDGIPVPHRRPPVGHPRDRQLVIDNAVRSFAGRLQGLKFQARTGAALPTWRTVRHPDLACWDSKVRLVMEVVSPWSISFDDFRKMEEYKRLPDMKAILLVDTEAPRATVWRRGSEGWT